MSFQQDSRSRRRRPNGRDKRTGGSYNKGHCTELRVTQAADGAADGDRTGADRTHTHSTRTALRLSGEESSELSAASFLRPSFSFMLRVGFFHRGEEEQLVSNHGTRTRRRRILVRCGAVRCGAVTTSPRTWYKVCKVYHRRLALPHQVVSSGNYSIIRQWALARQETLHCTAHCTNLSALPSSQPYHSRTNGLCESFVSPRTWQPGGSCRVGVALLSLLCVALR